ncbi:MAG: delta-60 repeat domain-containing protein, partial [Amnibacterium sp.]
LNDTSVSSLPDGVRLRRAMDTAGTTWQEARFTYSSPRVDWSWQFDDLQRIGTFSFDGVTGSGGTTESFGLDTAFQRVQTTTINNLRTVNGKTTGRNDGWSTGFGYGTGVTGSSASDSYLYQGSTGYVRPFTQVYLRPKLLSSSILSDIPSGGTPAVTRPAVAQSLALKTVWGVNGLGAAGTGIEDTEVSAFTQSGSRVFVGGNFAHVQQDSKGTGLVNQSYLAAFDVKTGQFIPTFKPVFNQEVKALATLPDGRIVAGGDFTTVNGVAENGLVVLDPTTGAIDPTFTGRLINALSTSGGQAVVRALDVQGGWLYVGGSFTHATGGSVSSQVYSRGAVRLSVTNGTPDKNLTFEFDGTVISLDASSQGDRVYFAGYFADDKTSSAYRVAAVTTANGGSVLPWTVNFTSPDSAATIAAGKTATYQQAVREVGNRVWIGGSEHMIFSYNRADLSEASTNVMSAEGGDGQVLATDGTNVYGGCHCYLGTYANAHVGSDWRDPGTAWTRASKIEAVGAWNATTGDLVAAFSPSFTEREGAGGWAVFTDSTGVTWMGGDFTAVRTGATGKSWAGGYARFAAADSTAPTTPTGLTVTTTASGVSVAWNASKDDSGAVTYQVLRKYRVVATTSSTSITLPAAPADPKYFVRAADAAGNLSASTAAVTATAPAAPTGGSGVLVAAGSSWHWLQPTTAPDASWNTAGFDDSSWSTGAAPLGWGDASIATVLPGSAPRPLTAYYRDSVTVKDPASLGTVTLTTRADDGVVLYVNGVEVGRANMPSGTVTNGTYASSAVTTANAVGKPVTFTVPASRFTSGTNVLAAEVHSNYKSTSSSSFDLTATADGKPVVPVQGVALPSGSVLVGTASTWAYSQSAAAQAADWASPAFDSSSWSTGKAVLGWGTGDIATQLPAAAGSRPLASYYRKSFDIPTGSIPSGGLTLTTRADDGVIVFVNGTEVGRSNLPSGTITGSTYALSAPSTTTAEANPVTFTVPASLLVDGTNVFAAQVQSNYKSTPSSSFDLKAVVK